MREKVREKSREKNNTIEKQHPHTFSRTPSPRFFTHPFSHAFTYQLWYVFTHPFSNVFTHPIHAYVDAPIIPSRVAVASQPACQPTRSTRQITRAPILLATKESCHKSKIEKWQWQQHFHIFSIFSVFAIHAVFTLPFGRPERSKRDQREIKEESWIRAGKGQERSKRDQGGNLDSRRQRQRGSREIKEEI